MVSANSKGRRSLGRTNVESKAIPSQDACCSNCKTLLDFHAPHSKRPFWRTLSHLIDSANECNLCALFYEGLSLEFELDIDIISNIHLDGSEVSFASYDPTMYSTVGPSGQVNWISLRLELGSKVWSLRPRHEYISLIVSFHVVRKGPEFFDRAYWKSSHPIELPARKATISDWLDKCQSSHSKCYADPSPRKTKPAHVIEITEHKRRTYIRLVTRAKLENQSARYVVLSHCWGGRIPHCRTTRRNKHEHYKSIPFDTFPQTFKDAVQIAKLLNIGYLWIDSMCIIQDDLKDWERESAKMAAIFQGAVLTISATTAENCYHGLGVEAPLIPARHLEINFGEEGNVHFAVRPTHHHDAKSTLSNSKIHERAWVFQEKLLSKRILHVTHGQLIWQCATEIESEDGMKHQQDYPKENRSRNFPQLYQQSPPQAWRTLDSHVPVKPGTPEHQCLRRLWWSWVFEYCGRKLTVAADHYAALAGAIRLYQKMSGDEPIIGLWKRDLPIHLAWHIGPTNQEEDAAQPSQRVPTWSWLSFPHGRYPIEAPLVPWSEWSPGSAYRGEDLEFTYQAMIHDIQIGWEGEELASQPTAGSLTIQSYFSQIHAPERLDTFNDNTEDMNIEDPLERLEKLALENLNGVENSRPTLRSGVCDHLFENHENLDFWNLVLDPDLATSEFRAEYFDTVVLYAYKDKDIGLNEGSSGPRDEYGMNNENTIADPPTWHIVHLVLKRVDDRNDVYQRIGLLHRQPDIKRSKEEVMSHLGEEKEITLI